MQYTPQYIRRYTAHLLTAKLCLCTLRRMNEKRTVLLKVSALGPNVMLSLKTRDLLSEHSIQNPLMPEKYVKTILLPNHLLWKYV